MLPELVSLDEIGIKGVRAKVLLKVRLNNARHPRLPPGHRGGAHGDPRGPHPDELVTGTLGSAVCALENVFGDLNLGVTGDEAHKGRLESVRDTLREVSSQAERQVLGAGGVDAGPALPEGQSSSAGEPPSGATPREE